MTVSKLLAASVVFGLALAGSARADIISYSPVTSPNFAGATMITFDDIALGSSSFTSQGVTFSGSGLVYQGSLDSYSATPAGDTSQYLTTQAGAGETLSFSAPENEFALYWGSIDTYNTITFYSGGNAIYSVTGDQLPPPPVTDFGSWTDPDANRYVNFNFGSQSFDTVVMTTGQPAFEVDDIAFADPVPEPAAWAMMLVGMAGVGFVARRRAVRTVTA